MQKQIVFDLDGTLIDSAPSILKCLSLTLNKNNIKPIVPLTHSLIGPPLDSTLRITTGINDPLIICYLVECFKEIYDLQGYKDSLPYFGVVRMLEQLNNLDYKIHIATNKRIVPTKKIIEYFLWNSYFDSVYALDVGDIKFKSKTEMLSSVSKDKNIDLSNTFYVGDTNADYEAAQKNNMQFIFVEWGYENKGTYNYPLSASNVDHLVKLIIN